MTYEEINQAVIEANKDENFINLFNQAKTPEEIDEILVQYQIIENDDDVAKFIQIMNSVQDELDENALKTVAGGGWTDIFNFPKIINEAFKEVWKGISGCFNAGKSYQSWLNKHGLG